MVLYNILSHIHPVFGFYFEKRKEKVFYKDTLTDCPRLAILAGCKLLLWPPAVAVTG